MLQLDGEFLVLDVRLGQRAFELGIVALVHVEADFIFGFAAILDELGIAHAQRGLARRPVLGQLAVDRVIFLVDLGDIRIVAQQVAVRHRAGDRGRIIIFEAALRFRAIGLHIEAVQLEIGVARIDFVAAVEAVILAIARVRLVLAIVEFLGRIIGDILGRIAVAQAFLLLGIVTTLKIAAQQQAARTDRAAPDEA